MEISLPIKIEGSIEFTIEEHTDERVVSVMPLIRGSLNPYGTVQAGAILWFADVSATALVNGQREPYAGMKGFPLAINLNANFISNQNEGTFRAESTFVKKGKTISIVRTVVYGENDKIIAEVTTNHIPAR